MMSGKTSNGMPDGIFTGMPEETPERMADGALGEIPNKVSNEMLNKEPNKEPSKEPGKEPDKEPGKEPDKEPGKEPDKVLNEMRLEFDSCSCNESFARVAVAAFMTQLDPTLEEVEDVKTAISEAVTNVIIHAYPEGGGKVWITCQIRENVLHVEVRDTGCGILDVKQAMEPLFTTRTECDRAGMGFAFMEAFMDTLEVVSEAGRGTLVRMSRRIMKSADRLISRPKGEDVGTPQSEIGEYPMRNVGCPHLQSGIEDIPRVTTGDWGISHAKRGMPPGEGISHAKRGMPPGEGISHAERGMPPGEGISHAERGMPPGEGQNPARGITRRGTSCSSQTEDGKCRQTAIHLKASLVKEGMD